MASHHEKNKTNDKPVDVQGPGSSSVVGNLSVSYSKPGDVQGPAPVVPLSQVPSITTQEPPLDSPNVPNPLGRDTTPKY